MTKKTNQQWLISTVVPVYNVEKYLAQTLDSVIAQSIGFEANVQIIIVDDGSSDGSDKICQTYVNQYPGNIQYIRQKNAGVSSARNKGLEAALGRYVHFLDSDDIISPDFYELATDFLIKHADEVDFVAPKIKLFDGNIDEHPNNYKFGVTRVIDVTKEPDNPIMHVSSCLFVAESLGEKRFDTRLKIAEDAKFVADVLSSKRKYGVLAKGCLNYRKRSDGSSAINSQFKQRGFYTDTTKYFLNHLLQEWRDKDGRPADYAQNVVLYDLKWRLGQEKQAVLSEGEEYAYRQEIRKYIKLIDDENIISKKGLSFASRIYMLKVKHDKMWDKNLDSKNGTYSFNGRAICRASDDAVHLDFIAYEDEKRELKIEGYSDFGAISSGDNLYVRVGLEEFPVRWVERAQRKISFLGEEIYSGGAFEVRVRIPNGRRTEVKFLRRLRDGSKVKLRVHTNRYTRLSVLPFTYSQEESVTIRNENKGLFVYERKWWRSIIFEAIYLGIISLNWRAHTVKDRLSKLRRYNLTFLSPKQKIIEIIKPFAFSVEAIAMIPKAILLRLGYHLLRSTMLKNKPIWMISDRGAAAGDNGEALYEYIINQDDLPAKVYFVIDRHSRDYRRIVKLGGSVLRQGSLKHQFLFLFADKIVSSQADVETTNPYIRQINHYVDLFDFDFVFLQHGIIRNDLSRWLNRFEKNIALFITSAEIEYQSILELPYYYTDKQVLLSGLPRYDLLDSHPANILMLAPTYRKAITRKKTNKAGAREYDPEFKYSDYWKFYNSLINNKRLREILLKYNIKGEFYLHPGFSAQAKDFDGNEQFTIKQFPYDYKKAFSQSSVLVSDFSSVVFDFAFLKKPVVYTQFDQETFFDGQPYDRGDFFSDVTDGFGPVTTTIEGLIEELKTVVEGGCKMDDKYKARVDSFYKWHDRGARSRVYNAILSMDSCIPKDV